MPGTKYEAMRIEVDDDGDEIEVLVKEVSEEWGGAQSRPSATRLQMESRADGSRWCMPLPCLLSRHRQGGHVCVYDATVQEGSVMGIKGEKR